MAQTLQEQVEAEMLDEEGGLLVSDVRAYGWYFLPAVVPPPPATFTLLLPFSCLPPPGRTFLSSLVVLGFFQPAISASVTDRSIRFWAYGIEVDDKVVEINGLRPKSVDSLCAMLQDKTGEG
eukprot:766337-Hanusia_phi.AAC.3